jgi:hypothetical protein
MAGYRLVERAILRPPVGGGDGGNIRRLCCGAGPLQGTKLSLQEQHYMRMAATPSTDLEAFMNLEGQWVLLRTSARTGMQRPSSKCSCAKAQKQFSPDKPIKTLQIGLNAENRCANMGSKRT